MGAIKHHHALPLLVWIDGIAGVLIGLGVGCWLWLLQHRDRLPGPEIKAGKLLLRQYLATAHDLFLALLALAVVVLLVLIQRAKRRHGLANPDRTAPELDDPAASGHPLLRFARQQPLVLALFAGYTVAMVHGTSWMYPELVGWVQGMTNDHLLNNFSVRRDFLYETMKRDDYRFFPLAHQDLHILSWFTPYVKVWMLVSAAELFTLVIVASRFVRRLSGRAQVPALLLITCLLVLFHPATGMAFFQFPYCERFLSFIFILYCGSYLHHLQTQQEASFYSTLLLGLIGIFIKDIAIVLFVVPPLAMVTAGSLGLVEGRPPWRQGSLKPWLQEYQLELWLGSLAIVFVLAYVVLSLLPSAYANAGFYNKDKEFLFAPDWRFWFLISFSLLRSVQIAVKRSSVNLLDALNAAAFLYAAGLLVLIGFEAHTYLTLPVQLVTVLDLGFTWACWISPALERRSSARLAGAVGSAVVLGSIGIDHLQPPNVTATVQTIKARQHSWGDAYAAIDAISTPIKAAGGDVNLIYSKRSWFSAKRHLGRLRFDRLIEFNPERNTFMVEAGIGKGTPYSPREGDLLFSIDQNGSDAFGQALQRWPTTTVYADPNGQPNGRIYRIAP